MFKGTLVGFFLIGLLVFSYQQVAFGQMGKNLEIKIPDGASDNDTKTAFYPDILPIEPGDSITWVNEDHAVHSITSGVPSSPEYSGVFFKTGSIDVQKSGTVNIEKIKDHFAFYYFCEIHPWMTGKIVISTAPESQPDTPLPIVVGQKSYSIGQNVVVTGKVADDYGRVRYQLLVYDQAKLVNSIEGRFNEDSTLSETVPTDRLGVAKYTLKLVYGLPTQIATASFDLRAAQEYKIPGWVKTEAKLWSGGDISDTEFIQAIQFLSEQKIISPQTGGEHSKNMPGWMRTNASWWTDGMISDTEFVNALKYLANEGIIQI